MRPRTWNDPWLRNGGGEYVISSVDPASYTVTVMASVSRHWSHWSSGFDAGVLTLDFSVQLGSTTDAIQVTEVLPIVESSNASNGQVIDTQNSLTCRFSGATHSFSRS